MATENNSKISIATFIIIASGAYAFGKLKEKHDSVSKEKAAKEKKAAELEAAEEVRRQRMDRLYL